MGVAGGRHTCAYKGGYGGGEVTDCILSWIHRAQGGGEHWGLGSLNEQGAVISLVTAVSWQHEWRKEGRVKKIVKREEWEAGFEFPGISPRGCVGVSDSVLENEVMAVFHTLAAPAVT